MQQDLHMFCQWCCWCSEGCFLDVSMYLVMCCVQLKTGGIWGHSI